MAEWSKAHAWKACKRVIVSWVRIPSSPPNSDFRRNCRPFGRFFLGFGAAKPRYFQGGRLEIGRGESRTFLFSKNRFNQSIWQKADFNATKSPLFAVFLRETAIFSHSRIGSIHALLASVNLRRLFTHGVFVFLTN